MFGHTRKLRLMLESMAEHRRRLGRPLRILDVGCGNGLAVSCHLPCGDDLYLGIDIHAPSIEFARTHFGGALREFSAKRLEHVEAGEFDVVVMSDVLEHVEDPAGLLETAAAKLAAGGLLLASVPNGRGPFEIESAISRTRVLGAVLLKITDYFVALLDRTVFPGRWRAVVAASTGVPYNAESGHVQFFRRDDVPRIAARCGLTLRRRANLSFLSGPFTNYLFAPWNAFVHWNVRVADSLSSAFVSAWYFEFARSGGVVAREDH